VHWTGVPQGQHQQLLNLDEVVPFLWQRGLMHERAILAGDLVVRDVSRRNRSFKIVGDPTARFFLKQPRDRDSADLVTTEARVYQWLETLPEVTALQPFLPRLRCFDADACTLVLDLVEDSCSVSDLLWRRRRLPAQVGGELGRALGTLHRVTSAALDLPAPAPDIGPAARYLQLHRPNLQTFIQSSAGTVQLVRTIQASSELTRLLNDLDRDWRPDAVIHADLRWDNCRIVEGNAAGAMSLTIVDWETAGVGDSCWDVGTFFGECLAAWLLSAPVTRDSPPETFLALARLSLTRMHPAIRQFWRCYARARAVEGPVRQEFFERAMRYAGARLLQHAFEEVQHETRMSATVVYLLQLGLNVLQRPLDAAVLLLGLPPTHP
jgi:aminoglycoside phosphotransferase (APT) family kinase protein